MTPRQLATSVPWISASMMADVYHDGIELHDHMVGGEVQRIRLMRENYAETPIADRNYNAAWPMVDLWARVPLALVKRDRHAVIDHVNKIRRQS